MTDAVLNNADWLHSESLHAVVTALSINAQPPRIVGGAVRDGLLGLPVSDVDLATMLHPKETIDRLEHAGIKAVPTGIDHGTITAVVNGHRYEITTLRRDVSTDGRRATVAFSTDWKEDAARRDFTINALFADPDSGAVYDYFGGLDDLKNGMVRFIGDAPSRIAEDHLRILRFFRFYARFGKGDPDVDAITACEAAAKSLMALSRERIAEEVMKLLALPNPADSVALMVKHNIFAAFLPELHPDAVDRLLRLMQRELQAAIAPKAGRRFNALLPDDRNIVDLVTARLKMSNKARAEMNDRLNTLQADSTSARALAYRHGIALATDMILLHGLDEDWQAALAQLADWLPPVFPVTGGALVTRGLSAGPDVAKTLRHAEQMWIDEGFPDADRAQAIADQLVVDRLSAKNP
jgi:poly(A) polymerase